MEKMDDTLDRFMRLTEEYKRFADYFNGIQNRVIEQNEDDEYVSVHTRLMLLRKYGQKNDFNLKNVLKKAGRRFPKYKEQFNGYKAQYDSIYKGFEYILPDGTSQNIGDAIEDIIYGLYLHPDSDRIQRVCIAEDSIRYAVTKEYVKSLEKVVLETYDLLLSCKEDWNPPKTEKTRAHIVFVGETAGVSHDIKGSPYWSNAYGRDASAKDLLRVFNENSDEDNHILMFCEAFIQKVCKENFSSSELQWYVFPPTKQDWGDFSVIHNAIIGFSNLGFSSKVRYNEEHNMAYVLLFNNIEEPFIVNQPHSSNDVTTITLVKDNERYGWRILSIGQPMDHYKEVLNLRDSVKKVVGISKDMVKRIVIKRLLRNTTH